MDVTSVLSLHPHLITLHFMNLLNSKMKVTQVFVLHRSAQAKGRGASFLVETIKICGD